MREGATILGTSADQITVDHNATLLVVKDFKITGQEAAQERPIVTKIGARDVETQEIRFSKKGRIPLPGKILLKIWIGG